MLKESFVFLIENKARRCELGKNAALVVRREDRSATRNTVKQLSEEMTSL
jgi:hypothetical protein